jgi:hypothetical protein
MLVGLPRMPCSMRPATVLTMTPETIAPDSSTASSAFFSDTLEKSMLASRLVNTMIARRPAGLAALLM